jgi:predicted GNAT family N-acyltransferase
VDPIELQPTDAPDLVRLYETYDWWADRTVEEVRTAVANSVAVGLRDAGDLVAAGQVVTDGVYYAKLYDVVVAEPRRDEGISTTLLKTICARPKLKDTFLAVTCREDLVAFYKQAGFEPYPSPVERPDGPAELMRHLYRP